MLVLSRQRDESIVIGDNVVVTIVDIRGDKVRLGIQAPEKCRCTAKRCSRPSSGRIEGASCSPPVAQGPAANPVTMIADSRQHRRPQLPCGDVCRRRIRERVLAANPRRAQSRSRRRLHVLCPGEGHIDTGQYRFTHELVDIETLNQRAVAGELELTAFSLHAYAYLADRYMLCSCGASMGDRYGPMVVAPQSMTMDDLAQAVIAVPGLRTTAYLALRLCLGVDFKFVLVPFDQILDAVAAGHYGAGGSMRG